MSESIHLRRLQGRLGELVYEMTKVQFAGFSTPQTWSPALNVYRCEGFVVVCADVAGVDKSAIELRVEPRRLLLRGRRETPEPRDGRCKALQVLAMEIDYGFFEREVLLPAEVQSRQVTAEQDKGLLWIYLPLREQA